MNSLPEIRARIGCVVFDLVYESRRMSVAAAELNRSSETFDDDLAILADAEEQLRRFARALDATKARLSQIEKRADRKEQP